MDAKTYRTVMSRWPTGVCVVTGLSGDETPLGMVIGSFTSVSLDPALVAFFVKTGSASWLEIERAGGQFCVNVLSHRQSVLCGKFSSGHVARRYEGVGFDFGENRAPRLHDCCAWIEAKCEKTIELGDHLMVLGRVTAMSVGSDALPLVFSRGRLHRTEPESNLSEDHFLHWEDSLCSARTAWRM